MTKLWQKAFLFVIDSKLLPIFNGSRNLTAQNLPQALPPFLQSKNIFLKLPTTPPQILSGKNPVIIYGRHSSIFDALLVAAALGSSANYQVVMLRILTLLFPGIRKNAIEVSSYTLAKGSWWNRLSMGLGPLIENIPLKKAIALNQQVVPKVVTALAAGQNVILFPDAGVAAKPWRVGLAASLQSFAQKYPTREVVLLPVFIIGYKKGDTLKQSIRMMIGYPPQKTPTVSFGKAIFLSDLLKKGFLKGEFKQSVGELTQFLEKQYRHQWYTRLHDRKS